MHIKGLQKLTLLDYKGLLSATIFTGGCNFTCPFCHNKDLVLYPNAIPNLSEHKILDFLSERRDRLEGVCITGGEPTLQKDLPTFLHRIKAFGYQIKLDTNGTFPETIKQLVSNQLVDYIAMDIKNTREKYASTIGCTQFDITPITKSIDYLLQSHCAYEFRTTIVRELHSEQDIYSICQWIQGADAYYLQPYVNSPQVIKPSFSSYTRKELEHFQSIAMQFVKKCDIIGL